MTHWQRTATVAWTDDGDDVAVATTPTTMVHVLTGSGALLWHLLDEPLTTDDLARRAARSAGLDPEEIHDDVAAFLTDLAERGLVRRAQADAE